MLKEFTREEVQKLHRAEILSKPNYARLQIGSIKGETPNIIGRQHSQLSTIPYGEPTWLTSGYFSPYYNESHKSFQTRVRRFVDEVVYQDAQIFHHTLGAEYDKAREEDGKRPSQSVLDAMADVNIHAMRLGPGKHLKGLSLFHGLVKPEEFDYFHELIITQEFTRCGARGYGDGLNAGMVIGLPPVLNFGSPELQAKVLPDVLAGKKFIWYDYFNWAGLISPDLRLSLAISEAFAGSDIMGMKATAKLSPDGKHYILNGTKKWITNGVFADYFTVGCRTESGFSVLLVERGDGVETKPIKTSYSSTAGTAYVTFDNVKVPVENLLGEDGGGIFVILRSEGGWANQRKVFGKSLNAQAVVRSRLAAMISRVESLQAWLENITYQMNNMSYKQQAMKLAGQIAFLKSSATQAAQDTARDAVQLFGGRGITKTGMGRFIEQVEYKFSLYHRIIPFDALLGGAEDVLADLGVRQAIRAMPKDVRL
ncbi:hypothetical protein Clacol_002809 [Clathrus columnatus]|uniref:Acyl-CoA dehydrogenase n=1 Tax=Clathrus columnatus TaxID=1419009 RepID=A0AAV5A9K5_9AGAM|nr:hypothetical protein Clacol_002809 [Clathrus columnatus]